MSKKKSGEKGRGIATLLRVWLFFLAVSIGVTHLPWVDLERLLELKQDFQFDLLSTSATIGGFLFTGMSIFLSSIDYDQIKRMWKHNYLDNVYRVAVLGVAHNILTILAALAMIIMKFDFHIQLYILRGEIVLLLISLIFFAWNVIHLVYVLSLMKPKS